MLPFKRKLVIVYHPISEQDYTHKIYYIDTLSLKNAEICVNDKEYSERH